MSKPRLERVPFLALGALALVAAMWAGLYRMGWALPSPRPALTLSHGPLMVSGFLGTLISLERAVALGARWMYAAPLLSGLGGLALIAGLPVPVAAALITLGSCLLVAIFAVLVRRQPAMFTLTMALAALVWLGGNGLWLAGRPLPIAVPWWAGFLILTIAGERLELSRMLRPSPASRVFFGVAAGIFVAGLALTTFTYDSGIRLTGVGMLALTAWLAKHDVARRTVRQAGLTRFIAVCLLSGYVWLGVAGFLALGSGGVMAGFHYDAYLHAIFLGFVFAMIFGHAPVIIPAVLGVAIPFRPGFYIHLVLLHLSLLVRVAGDLAGAVAARQWGGLLNVAALLLFLTNTAWATLGARGDR